MASETLRVRKTCSSAPGHVEVPEYLERGDHCEQMFLGNQSFPSVLCGQMVGTLIRLGAHRPSYCTFNLVVVMIFYNNLQFVLIELVSKSGQDPSHDFVTFVYEMSY